jgi:hypothetical protein
MKRAASKFLLLSRRLVVITVMTLMLGEASLRVYDHFQPSYFFYNESHNKRFRGKSSASDGKFKLNSLGFKDKEFTQKPVNGYRIVALGDSFAFGVVPYEANYLTLVETSLQKNYPNADLLNMGIVGTGPVDYWELLRDEGLSYEPDLVLLSFFIGNDFVGPKRRRWYELSYVTTLIYRASKVARNYQGPLTRASSSNYCDDCATMTEERYLKVEGQRSKKYIKGYKRFSRSVDVAMTYLEKIQALCKQRGAQLVVVLIPDELQINRDLQKAVRAKFHSHAADNDWDTALPNRTLMTRLNKVGIDTIDLYDSFVAVGARKSLYKPRDTHWNIAGNQLAADVISAHLDKLAKRNK